MTLHYNKITMKLFLHQQLMYTFMTAFYPSDIYIYDQSQLTWLIWCDVRSIVMYNLSL